VFAPFLDPKRRSLKLLFRAYNILIDATVGMQAVLFAAMMLAAFDNRFDVTKIVLVAVGLLFERDGSLVTSWGWLRPTAGSWSSFVVWTWSRSSDAVLSFEVWS
jgi:hypothetical protein